MRITLCIKKMFDGSLSAGDVPARQRRASAIAIMESLGFRDYAARAPHPHKYRASVGETLLDWYCGLGCFSGGHELARVGVDELRPFTEFLQSLVDEAAAPIGSASIVLAWFYDPTGRKAPGSRAWLSGWTNAVDVPALRDAAQPRAPFDGPERTRQELSASSADAYAAHLVVAGAGIDPTETVALLRRALADSVRDGVSLADAAAAIVGRVPPLTPPALPRRRRR